MANVSGGSEKKESACEQRKRKHSERRIRSVWTCGGLFFWFISVGMHEACFACMLIGGLRCFPSPCTSVPMPSDRRLSWQSRWGVVVALRLCSIRPNAIYVSVSFHRRTWTELPFNSPRMSKRSVRIDSCAQHQSDFHYAEKEKRLSCHVAQIRVTATGCYNIRHNRNDQTK